MPRRTVWSLTAASLFALALTAALGAFAADPPAAKDAAGWTPLFNGKDLEGWTVTGQAAFKVEDGCLVGTPVDAKGGDIYTKAEYDNFEVRFTYKMVWPANSGVWFRDKYQFDILKWPDPVAFSGTLYCPGKMFIAKNLDESIENRDGWNEGQIYANGDHLILWLNGKKVADLTDKTLAKGKIGIQVHGGEQFKAMKATFKNIEVRPLKAGDPPTEPAPPKAAAK